MANLSSTILNQLRGTALNTTIGAQGAGLTLNNVSSPFKGLANISISDDWANPHVKKYEVIEITEDLLALSATWERLRKEAKTDNSKYVSITTITDKILFDKVTPEDRQRADQIRDYYSKKIMMWKLKGANLSRFREDMSTLIHSNGTVFKDNIRPLAYRLPEFYEYDIQFEDMVREHNRVLTGLSMTRAKKTLTLQKTFTMGKSYSKRKEFWFSDEHKNLITFTVKSDNLLLTLLEKYTQTPIEVEALYSKKIRDGVEYYIADKFNFA